LASFRVTLPGELCCLLTTLVVNGAEIEEGEGEGIVLSVILSVPSCYKH
jgi:hypothetical protein